MRTRIRGVSKHPFVRKGAGFSLFWVQLGPIDVKLGKIIIISHNVSSLSIYVIQLIWIKQRRQVNPSTLPLTLRALDKHLGQTNEQKHLYICGGAALILLGKVSRNTRDIDVVDPLLDEEMLLAATKTAKDFLLQTNRWLYNRQLFGTNFRADMATVMELHLATNAYQAMKVLGCSLDTAYRNWNALNEIDWPNWLSLEAG